MKTLILFVLLSLIGNIFGLGTDLQMSTAAKQAVLDRHNFHRANVNPTASNMQFMQWDDELEAIALAYSLTCTGSGSILDHNTQLAFNTGYQGPAGAANSVGENIAAFFPQTEEISDLTSRVDSWASEVADFTYSPNNGGACAGVCGHYTQVVWAESNRVGCAYVSCPNLNIEFQFLCNYASAGNFIGNPPYVSGENPPEGPLIDNQLPCTSTTVSCDFVADPSGTTDDNNGGGGGSGSACGAGCGAGLFFLFCCLCCVCLPAIGLIAWRFGAPDSFDEKVTTPAKRVMGK